MKRKLTQQETADMLNMRVSALPRLIKMGLKRYISNGRYYFKTVEILNFKKSVLDVYTAIGGSFGKGRPREYFSPEELQLNNYYTGKYANDSAIKKSVKDGVVRFDWKQII